MAVQLYRQENAAITLLVPAPMCIGVVTKAVSLINQSDEQSPQPGPKGSWLVSYILEPEQSAHDMMLLLDTMLAEALNS